MGKETMRKLEKELNTIQKEIMYVENDIKLLTEDYNKMVEGNDSVLNSVISQTADIKIKIESNLLTKKYLEEAGDQLVKGWECYRRAVDSALDDFSADGIKAKQLKLRKKELEDKIEVLLENEGSIEEIELATNLSQLEVDKLEEEKVVLENECRKLQDVVRERKAILSRREIENRMQENRLEAQKRRLLKLLASASPPATS